MHAIKLKTRINPDRKMELQLPSDTPIADAEIIVLIGDAVPEISPGNALLAYLNQLDQSSRPRLSRETVDAWIENERAWEQ